MQCSWRGVLLVVLILQMLTTIERQVFDFLGYMWAVIIINFIHASFIIIGLFGVYQYRVPYVITYAIWCLIWFALNLLIICIYLEIGTISYQDDWLSLGTGHDSWWRVNGYGCTLPTSNYSTPGLDRTTTAPPPQGCLIDFQFVETIHASIQCLLAFLSFCLASWVSKAIVEEDDTDHFDFIGGFDAYSAYQPPSKSSRLQMQPISF